MTAAMMIYKIFRAGEWQAFQDAGETQGAPIDLADGYIHFSTIDQVEATAAKHFAGTEALVLLGVDTASMDNALRWEPSRGGALFPHLYGMLRIGDVLWSEPLPLVDGRHQFPGDL